MIVDQYQPDSPEAVQEAIKDIFGPIFEAMLQGEMECKRQTFGRVYGGAEI